MMQTIGDWPDGDAEMAVRIRGFDWAATPLGPIEGWSDRLRLMVEQVLASPLVASLVCGPERILIYNAAAAGQYGNRRPAALGRPLPETFPEGWATVAPFYARAFAGETVQVAGQPLDTRGDGAASDLYDALLMPVRETDGRVAYVHMTGSEVSQRARAEAALRESETRHRLLIESWTEAVWETDADGVVLADSPSWRAYTGQTREEWLGYGWLDAIHPDDRAFAERQWRDATAVRGPVNAEFRLRAPDGGWRWTNVRAAPVLDTRGDIEKWAGINIDIGARKLAEQELRASEERLRRVLDGMGEGFGLLAPDFTILEHNQQALRMDGRTRGEIVGRTHWEAFPGSETSEVGRFLKKAMAEREPMTLEHRYAWEQGRSRWLDMRAYPTADDMLAVFWHDVTDRKEAEVALRASEERYRSLFEAMDEAYAVVEVIRDESGRWSDFRFLEVNPAFTHHTAMPYPVGRTATELLGSPNPRWTELYGQALDAGEPIRVEEAEHTLGPMFDLNIFTLDRARNRVAVLFTDITARKKAEAALRESEGRFAQFAASSSDALWIRDADTLAMEYTSPAIQTIYGISPDAILGDIQRWVDLILPEDRETAIAHIELARDGDSVTHEFRIRRPRDGAVRWIRNTDFPLRDQHGRVQRIGGLAEDVTEARELRERQAVLVGELQHRTRNLMGVVRSMADDTLRSSVDLADFQVRYGERLEALTRVQGLLSRMAEGRRITFDQLIYAELAALDGTAEKVRLSGPNGVALRSSTVQTFALALHELATNAVKYGAFSQPQGRLDIRWSVERIEGDERPWLNVAWEERAVVMPAAGEAGRGRGSGRELIERALPYQLGAKTTYVMEADGIRCTIALPVSERQAMGE